MKHVDVSAVQLPVGVEMEDDGNGAAAASRGATQEMLWSPK